MASRTQQPREREGEESREKKRKREDRREKQRRRRGKREGGDMRESVRPVQRWSALSYRAGDYRRCSVRWGMWRAGESEKVGGGWGRGCTQEC